jgi:hypothetical protein
LQTLDPNVNVWSRERLAWLVMGIVAAKSAAPARIARALYTLGLSYACAESLERRVRRIQNDAQITAALCLHPFAKQHLALGRPKHLLLVIDPTTQEDRLVMLTVAVWYRGRALPLAWEIWPGNQVLEGEGFWQRVQHLLDTVAPLLPKRVPVIWLADRAFGTPQFTDRVQAYGWHFVVRIQNQTRCRDRVGFVQSVGAWLAGPHPRKKGCYDLFKKLGWRPLSLVGHWGERHRQPLCVVSDLPVGWYLLALYRRRFAIEGMFRDLKSSGWQWESGQGSTLYHLSRLLVGMALATWVTLLSGSWMARQHLARKASGERHTRPWHGKYSLFTLGLDCLHRWMQCTPNAPLDWHLSDWEAPHWQAQCLAHQVRAYIFHIKRKPVRP